MPANELEGLIRDRLPDAVRRHLRDVQIDRIDRDDSKPNWIGMPIWETDPMMMTNGNSLRPCIGFAGNTIY
jgi:hypothetical protein